ncbi:hypothetical protein UFOVP755_40 [uncultured Caudovirales phage]|uniref:Uncharacterized protein n=1 Tax=uncultured Caudovirales phage TaxID=2100421 RepID=A0A6J7XDY6_9CAUD|nr:hypothetical protein UFOVP755_40 [uncultured Caudovirales phage]
MQFINITPHSIDLLLDNKKISIPPTGVVARCSVDSEQLPTISATFDSMEFEIPMSQTRLGEIVGLPPKMQDTYYITSIVVAQKASQLGRVDVIVPDVIRDSKGNIVGCKGFYRP